MMSFKLKCHRLTPFFISLMVFTALFVDGESSFAQTSLELTPATCIGYADFCFKNRDYPAAAEAYQQFIYFFPEDGRVALADYQIGLCCFYEKSYDRALNRFTRILEEKGLIGAGMDSAFMIPKCYQHMGDTQAAIDHLLYLEKLTEDPDLLDKINHHLGWLYLESGQFNAARQTFARIRLTENRIGYETRQIDEYLETRDRIPRKSPVAAGIFSVVPGGGYLYCGRYQDALVAFVVNSALMVGAWECFDEDLEAVGVIMAALGLGFYAGNIYGGISSAYKYNQANRAEFVRQMKKNLNPEVSLGFFIRESAAGFALSRAF